MQGAACAHALSPDRQSLPMNFKPPCVLARHCKPLYGTVRLYSLPQVTHVDELLRDYEAHPGVSFYWVLLGSSGHVKRPNATVVSSYTKCTPDNHNFNTQVRETRKWRP